MPPPLMPTPFLGEIKLFTFEFTPKGWAPCNGQEMRISQFQALYALLGTTYGGNGTTTFRLPDLRGRVAVQASDAAPRGSSGGKEAVTLDVNELPAHNHNIATTTAEGDTGSFADGAIAATSPNVDIYKSTGAGIVPLGPQSITHFGQSMPHDNCQPSLVMNFCIATEGVFPNRN